MKIVDSHCHLDLIEKNGHDIDQIVQNAKDNKVEILQTISTKISEIDKILGYTKKYDNVFASVGNHPCNVKDEGVVTAQEIIKICQENPKIIGIGETGLDYFHDKSNIDQQKESFYEHIKAAQEIQLPLIIHSRDCDDDMIKILKTEQEKKRFPALLHCFSSSKKLAEVAVELGIYISFSGIVTFKNAKIVQEVALETPENLILVETDSPYLAPTPHRGKENQPSYTRHTVEFVANLRNADPEKFANKTTENFFELFSSCHIESISHVT